MPQIGMLTSFDTKFKGVKQFTLQAKWDMMAAHDMIIANHVKQMFHANKKCHTSVRSDSLGVIVYSLNPKALCE